MTRTELKAAADRFVQMARTASEGMRTVYLRKARDRYEDLGLTGLAQWCEKHMG